MILDVKTIRKYIFFRPKMPGAEVINSPVSEKQAMKNNFLVASM